MFKKLLSSAIMAAFTLLPLAAQNTPRPDASEAARVTDQLQVVVRDSSGGVVYEGRAVDLTTDAGADLINDAAMTTGTQPAACNYLALTADTGTPLAADTTLTGEIATNGLARAQATYSHIAGTTSSTLTHQWTASGTQSVNRVAVFNAAVSGTMCWESPTFASGTANLTSGSTLTVTYTIGFP